MEIDLALLADAATVDAAGKLNVLGIFDRVSATNFPAQHGRMCLVLRFAATVAEIGAHEVLITLKAPAGREVFKLDGQMNLRPGPGSAMNGIRLPQVLNMDGLVFEEAGQYNFDVTIDGQHHVSVPLFVAGGSESHQA